MEHKKEIEMYREPNYPLFENFNKEQALENYKNSLVIVVKANPEDSKVYLNGELIPLIDTCEVKLNSNEASKIKLKWLAPSCELWWKINTDVSKLEDSSFHSFQKSFEKCIRFTQKIKEYLPWAKVKFGV